MRALLSTILLCGCAHKDQATTDLALPPDPPPNPTAGNACAAIFDCVFQMQKSAADCAMGKPAAAVAAYEAIIGCVNNQCGNTLADSGVSMPCNGSPDLGTQCNDCFHNTLIGGVITWQDGQGHTLACQPTNSPDCGK